MKNLSHLTALFFAVSTSTVMTGHAYAEVSEAQWAELNKNLVQQHVLPRYQALNHAAETLQITTKELCTKNDAAQLSKAQNAFKDTLSAWQSVQHIQFGPIELLMRSYSLQFWPDKKNLTSKQLNKLLLAEDPKNLTPEFFQAASIAVKGLPAMERLLFSANAEQALAASSYRCQFLTAVAQYVHTTTDNTYNEWQSFQLEISETGEDALYTEHKEASVDLMKAQVEPLEIIRDLKLIRPLGKSKAKAKRLESWRSGQSLQNIQRNIQSLQHMYNGVNGLNLHQLLIQESANDRANAITELFTRLEQRLASLPSPLAAHIHESNVRSELETVITELSDLHEHLGKGMGILSLQLGFNSRDGD